MRRARAFVTGLLGAAISIAACNGGIVVGSAQGSAAGTGGALSSSSSSSSSISTSSSAAQTSSTSTTGVGGATSASSSAESSSASSSSAGGGSSSSTGAGGSGTCQIDATSTLPGVSFEFLTTKCTYTLAEAQAGIGIDYRMVVADDVAGLTPTPQDIGGGCEQPGPSGLIVFEILSGNNTEYCYCDLGPFCPPPAYPPFTLAKGAYPATFKWDGQAWTGPSDFSNPEGPPFPPGVFTLAVSAKGNVVTPNGMSPFEVKASFALTLVP